jgi:hypothetical protein
MKTKPITFGLASIFLLATIFLLVRCSSKRSEMAEVKDFLAAFNDHVNKGNTDSLQTCFDTDGRNPEFKRLINMLSQKVGVDGKSKPLAGINLDIDKTNIDFINPGLAQITIPIKFTNDDLPSKYSTLILKVKKNDSKRFKITQVDAKSFVMDLMAYENHIRTRMIKETDIYSPITLRAFATAAQLKVKYDSVIWFAHIKQQTYFYVVKGKWDMYESRLSGLKPYTMGLVGPDQKEIIPAEYDLIHNIGDAITNMVEVEQGNKKGIYNLTGKIVVPVIYDHIYLVNDDDNLAVLNKGNDFYWLRNDYSVSEKVDLKMGDILIKMKQAGSFTISNYGTADNITEFNSREMHGSVYLPPSYLVDLNLLPAIKCFKNPIRNKVDFYDVSTNYTVKVDATQSDDSNWFQSAFYNIRDYFLGGRAEFYDKKNLVIIDKRSNTILSTDINTSYGEMDYEVVDPSCDINEIRALNDSLFEVKTGASLYAELYDSTKYISGGTYYHYLIIKDNKLVELPNQRIFGFSKYVKMDESYLSGCYNLFTNLRVNPHGDKKNITQITPELLRYIKNEIYADYRYHFKDKRWRKVFANITGEFDSFNSTDRPVNISVDDSLTIIDKYNINFIDQKLKALKPVTLASK